MPAIPHDEDVSPLEFDKDVFSRAVTTHVEKTPETIQVVVVPKPAIEERRSRRTNSARIEEIFPNVLALGLEGVVIGGKRLDLKKWGGREYDPRYIEKPNKAMPGEQHVHINVLSRIPSKLDPEGEGFDSLLMLVIEVARGIPAEYRSKTIPVNQEIPGSVWMIDTVRYHESPRWLDKAITVDFLRRSE